MRQIKKTVSKNVISDKNQNPILETFISMKYDTECNETTPAIVFYRFHEDSEKNVNFRVKTAIGTPP